MGGLTPHTLYVYYIMKKYIGKHTEIEIRKTTKKEKTSFIIVLFILIVVTTLWLYFKK